eukprot:GHRR01036636.1.p1 GENE.GHRR01036636.1~~GHRR01036636.1.p1  ORF type:complete len:1113 (+),score=386.06 GHRR01036636.1:209-3547(+)
MATSPSNRAKESADGKALVHVQCPNALQSKHSTAAADDYGHTLESIDVDVHQPSQKLLLWRLKHPWLAAATAAVIAASLLLLVVLLPVCLTKGCQPKAHVPKEGQQDLTAIKRLIVSFQAPGIDALSALPPEIRRFASNLKINSSQLQVLSLSSEAMLQQAKRIISEHPEIDFVLRDFNLSLGDARGKHFMQSQPQQHHKQQHHKQQQPVQYQQQQQVQQQPWQWLQQQQRPMHHDQLQNGSSKQLAPVIRRLQQTSSSLIPPPAPNDPMYSSQAYLRITQASEAWALTRGQDNVIVAVLDTGADTSHPDLQGNLWVNYKEIPGNGIDDGRNGYVDDVNGYSFLGACLDGLFDMFGSCQECTHSSDITDTAGHGTHMAGIIAAVRNNGVGMTGAAPNVKVMILSVADCIDGTIYASAVAQAMDYALKMGAHVLSCSFSNSFPLALQPSGPPGPWDTSSSQTATFVRAAKPLETAGVLIVAAAGNSQVNLDLLQSLGYSNNPCLTPLTNIICVGATDNADNRASYSNYGTKTVQISAPGSITSTWTGGGYKLEAGTSMATPLVSSAAALIISLLASIQDPAAAGAAEPPRAAGAVKALLLSTADLPAAGANTYKTRLNSARAVGQALAVYAPTNMTSVLPKPQGQPVMSLPGFNEVYYDNKLGPWMKAVPVDVGIRTAAVPLAGFQYGAGYTLKLSASMAMKTSGVYNLRLQGTSAGAQVLVGQQPTAQVLLPTNGTQATFLLRQAPGTVDIDIVLPNPGMPVDVLLKTPESGKFQRFSGFQVAVPTVSGGSAGSYVPAAGLVTTLVGSGFVVLYNFSSSAAAKNTTSTLNKTLLFLKNRVVLPGLNYTSGALKPLLLSATPTQPSSSSTNGVVGAAVGALNISKAGQYAFQVTCQGCTLWLNNQAILDSWEAANTATGSAKQSPCVSLNTAGRQPLLLTFASTNVSAMPLVVRVADCGSSTWKVVQSSVSPGLVEASKLAGSAGGMRCLAYKGASLPNVPNPTAASLQPLFTAQLPTSGSSMDFKSTLDVSADNELCCLSLLMESVTKSIMAVQLALRLQYFSVCVSLGAAYGSIQHHSRLNTRCAAACTAVNVWDTPACAILCKLIQHACL